MIGIRLEGGACLLRAASPNFACFLQSCVVKEPRARCLLLALDRNQSTEILNKRYSRSLFGACLLRAASPNFACFLQSCVVKEPRARCLLLALDRNQSTEILNKRYSSAYIGLHMTLDAIFGKKRQRVGRRYDWSTDFIHSFIHSSSSSFPSGLN